MNWGCAYSSKGEMEDTLRTGLGDESEYYSLPFPPTDEITVPRWSLCPWHKAGAHQDWWDKYQQKYQLLLSPSRTPLDSSDLLNTPMQDPKAGLGWPGDAFWFRWAWGQGGATNVTEVCGSMSKPNLTYSSFKPSSNEIAKQGLTYRDYLKDRLQQYEVTFQKQNYLGGGLMQWYSSDTAVIQWYSNINNRSWWIM